MTRRYGFLAYHDRWLHPAAGIVALFLKEQMQIELVEYIKPGEFTFCSRCGSICSNTNKAFMCVSCKSSLFPSSKQLSQFEMDERLLESKIEIIVSDIYKEHRKDLAKLRKVANETNNINA